LAEKLYDLHKLRHHVVEHQGKIDAKKIGITAIHRIKSKNSYIDFLCVGFDSLKLESSVLVCFTAAVSDRSKKSAPFFSGVKVSKHLGIPLISIADPTVSEYSTGLAWYAGNEQMPNLQSEISVILQDIYDQLNFDQYILFGGSAGGFACLTQLMLIDKMKLKSLVMNPQTLILEYKPLGVRKYVEKAFGSNFIESSYSKEGAKDVLEKYNIIHQIDVNKIHPNHELVYLQNGTDWHVDTHLIPFLENSATPWSRVGNCSFSSGDKLGLYIGSWGISHAPAPIEVVFYFLNGLIDDVPPSSLVEKLESSLIAVNEDSNFYGNDVFDLEWSFEFLVKGDLCKVKVQSSLLSKIPGVGYAFYLKHNKKGIVTKEFYKPQNQHTFSLGEYDIQHLSIKVFIKLPDNSRFSKTKTLS